MRNNPKPGGKVDWDATGNITEPNAGRKTSGWLFTVKPPAQNFNWFWNLLGLQQFYSNAQVQDWIVIDSDADEQDYATLTAYLADSPTAGDRLLIKKDQTVAVQTVIPSDITLKFLDGARLLCATDIATSILQLGSNIIIEGVLNLVLSQTGTTDKAVEFNGDNVNGRINVENASTGTLTTAYNLNAGKTGNNVDGFAQNTGGGTLSNTLVDNSTEDSNNVIIVDEPNNKLTRSRGAYKFREGFEFDLGSDANGDIYYRDAGVLKRLPKAANDTWLKLASGLPAWSNVGKFLGGMEFDLGSDADGDIYYRDAGILKRLPKGNDNEVLTLASGIPAWTNTILSESFTSSEQTITAAGPLTLAHGLASTPYLIMPYIICKTSEFGYSIGDEVLINPAGNDPASASSRGLSVVPDGTNVNIRYGVHPSVIGILDKTTGSSTSITPANWKLIIRAWA